MSVPDTTRPQTPTLDQIQRPEDLRALPDEALPAVVEELRSELIDAVSDAETLGKPVGADALAGKATFVTLLGVEAARARAAQEISAARSALSSLGDHINDDGAALAFLSSLAEFVLTRHH